MPIFPAICPALKHIETPREQFNTFQLREPEQNTDRVDQVPGTLVQLHPLLAPGIFRLYSPALFKRNYTQLMPCNSIPPVPLCHHQSQVCGQNEVSYVSFPLQNGHAQMKSTIFGIKSQNTPPVEIWGRGFLFYFHMSIPKEIKILCSNMINYSSLGLITY